MEVLCLSSAIIETIYLHLHVQNNLVKTFNDTTHDNYEKFNRCLVGSAYSSTEENDACTKSDAKLSYPIYDNTATITDDNILDWENFDILKTALSLFMSYFQGILIDNEHRITATHAREILFWISYHNLIESSSPPVAGLSKQNHEYAHHYLSDKLRLLMQSKTDETDQEILVNMFLMRLSHPCVENGYYKKGDTIPANQIIRFQQMEEDESIYDVIVSLFKGSKINDLRMIHHRVTSLKRRKPSA